MAFVFKHHIFGCFISLLYVGWSEVNFHESPVSFFYVKTHKTGSTTAAALLRIGAEKRGYNCFYPPVPFASHLWTWESPLFRTIINKEIDSFSQLNCWTLHSILTDQFLKNTMKPNTLIITSFRNPIQRMLSAFHHYHPSSFSSLSFDEWVDHLYTQINPLQIPQQNIIGHCENVSFFSNQSSFYHMSEAVHLGFNSMTAQLLPLFESYSCENAFKKLLKKVQNQDDLFVIVLERFDESLIILKYKLGWQNNGSIDNDDILKQKDNDDSIFADFAHVSLNTKLERGIDDIKQLTSQTTLHLLEQLCWRDILAYQTATETLTNMINNWKLNEEQKEEKENNHHSGEVGGFETDFESTASAEVQRIFDIEVQKLREDSRYLQDTCDKLGWDNDEQCAKRKQNDKDWAYEHKLKMITKKEEENKQNICLISEDENNIQQEMKPDLKTMIQEKKVTKAVEEELSFISKCEVKLRNGTSFPNQIEIDDDDDGHEENADWISIPCSAAHYTLPHNVLFDQLPYFAMVELETNDAGFMNSFDDDGCDMSSLTQQIHYDEDVDQDKAKRLKVEEEEQEEDEDKAVTRRRIQLDEVGVVKRGGCSFTCKAVVAQFKNLSSLLMIDFSSIDDDTLDNTPQSPMIAGDCPLLVQDRNENVSQQVNIPIIMVDARALQVLNQKEHYNKKHLKKRTIKIRFLFDQQRIDEVDLFTLMSSVEEDVALQLQHVLGPL